METPPNRMAIPNRRGRPTEDEESKRVPVPAEVGEQVIIIKVIKCPHCGRFNLPIWRESIGRSRYVDCKMCCRRVRIDYDQTGIATTVCAL